jgi:hypothetical protein
VRTGGGTAGGVRLESQPVAAAMNSGHTAPPVWLAAALAGVERAMSRIDGW